MENKQAVLVLEDGTAYYGKAAGKLGTTTGEICFNTGMTGYQEVFTDPSYFGQLLVMTNAHIGNYGTKKLEEQSEGVKIAGLVCKNFTNKYSRPQADSSIQDYCEGEALVSISDVDTRSIVRHIRSKGAMNAIISSETLDVEVLKQKLSEVPSMKGLELSSKVCTKEIYTLGESTAKYKVAVLDLGVKKSILNCMVERDCFLKVFPAKTSFEEMKAFSPDGFFISNGPGDPSAMDYAVDTVKSILADETPLFGICLGNQILGRALGMSTYKMHNGHRGVNHPVKNLKTGLCEITSQNHGFSIDPKSFDTVSGVKVTHVNLNDDTIEGIATENGLAFSVQYHPESAPGPHDSRYLFDDFVELIKSKSK